MIFVTGANGFVGKHLCHELSSRKIEYKAGVRKFSRVNQVEYGDFTLCKDWGPILIRVDVVIHLVARVHVMNENSTDPLAAFMATNCDATINLARAAKEAGVKRFIFLSSVKVNGEGTFDKAFTARDEPSPQDPYGISKMEAEKALMKLHESGVFEIVIIRPPLIYGKGVKANFLNLLNLVKKGIPLPFGMADSNKRSLVSVHNLIDILILCTHHKGAAGQVFMVSDDCDLSTKELVLKMGKASNSSLFLLPVPLFIMKFVAFILGKKAYSERLLGNLQVDISETKSRLNWRPTYTFEETSLL
ncbi:MAG TPA: SDR family oxidoreductase [Bacteriovoracaceae bacterium]|nr:SDR family oxidoreductase [Bacteriovoracaceae bacterium]